jgi:hypothetical protein
MANTNALGQVRCPNCGGYNTNSFGGCSRFIAFICFGAIAFFGMMLVWGAATLFTNNSVILIIWTMLCPIALIYILVRLYKFLISGRRVDHNCRDCNYTWQSR